CTWGWITPRTSWPAGPRAWPGSTGATWCCSAHGGRGTRAGAESVTVPGRGQGVDVRDQGLAQADMVGRGGVPVAGLHVQAGYRQEADPAVALAKQLHGDLARVVADLAVDRIGGPQHEVRPRPARAQLAHEAGIGPHVVLAQGGAVGPGLAFVQGGGEVVGAQGDDDQLRLP